MRVNAGGRTGYGLGVLSAWLPKLPVQVLITEISIAPAYMNVKKGVDRCLTMLTVWSIIPRGAGRSKRSVLLTTAGMVEW